MVSFLTSERVFFEELAQEMKVSFDEFRQELDEQIESGGRPCVSFHEDGSVSGIDAFQVPGMWSAKDADLDFTVLRRLVEVSVFSHVGAIRLKDNAHLRGVKLAFCGLTSLELPATIEHLEVAGNPLEEFDARGFPRLKTLNCAHTQIRVLDVSALADLEELTCGWNDNSYYREGWSGPKLETLELGRSAVLKRVTAQNWLYPGTPAGARLSGLDVGGLSNLEYLNVAQNDLSALELSENKALKVLVLSGNPLTELDVDSNEELELLHCHNTKLRALSLRDHPRLTSLQCGNKELESVVLSGAGGLTQLYVFGSSANALDLQSQQALATLYLEKCRLESLDVRPAAGLKELTLKNCRRLKEVVCSERQKQVVPGLRKFFKLSKPTKDPKKMDAFTLHEFVAHYNWDRGPKPLTAAIRNPNCSLATLLLIYWHAQPEYYLRYETDDEALKDPTGKRILPLIREIEERVEAGQYAHHPSIEWRSSFAPRSGNSDEHKRTIPTQMMKLSNQDHFVVA